ncbi:protein PIN-LIKES 3 isoform X2 [Ricinus communis]|uniref:protein PIN-LIKES 3 isoform X2 n=1 Tax=Ricinus communis TaxID=3988 RepID=UPI0007728CD4|nr:protein PIN-LIKES 3 isoform X2 [Ricinus communis]|eukprot:XP_015580458.1 protein PIN-LIKES 3 isoform X2 [Ricinus communis]
MGLLDIFIASVIPVVKVLLITAVGSFLAIDYVDILGVDARKHLNNIVFFVFNPALVGSNIAKYITLRSMGVLWFMPLNILITFIIGSMLGWLLIKSTKAPHELWGLVLGCCSAGNLGNLPMIIIPTVCKERGSPFGDVDVCYTHGLAYASLSMAIGSIYMWSYVYNIVRLYSNKDCGGTKLDAITKGAKSSGETPKNLSRCCTGPLLPLENSSRDEEHMDCFELECTLSKEKEEVSILDRIKQGLQMVTEFKLKRLFAPSTTGAVIGFIIGTTPQLREALIGDNAPLHVIPDSASLLGDAAIPSITLGVGANLLTGLKGSAVQLPVIVGIMVVRYIILPICGVVIVKSAVHLGLVQSDPLYQFVLLLQFALPPAMNIGMMTQLFGAGESECSVILLWSYAVASVSLTLWSTFFMWLVG